MVATFLESMDTDDAEAAEYLADYGRPSWSEVASVAALAVRLRLGAALLCWVAARAPTCGPAARVLRASARRGRRDLGHREPGRRDGAAFDHDLGKPPAERAAGPGPGGVPQGRPTGAAPALAGRAGGRHRRARGSVAAGAAYQPLGVAGLAWPVLPGAAGRGRGAPGRSGPGTEGPRAVLVAGSCAVALAVFGLRVVSLLDYIASPRRAAFRPAGAGCRGSPCGPGRGVPLARLATDMLGRLASVPASTASSPPTR